jgi:hypothetical protein
MKSFLSTSILIGVIVLTCGFVFAEERLSPRDIFRSCLCEITTVNFINGSESHGTGVIIRENDISYLYSNAHVLFGGKIVAKNLLGQNVILGDPQILEDDPRDMIRFKVDSNYGFRIGKLPQPASRIFSYGDAGGEGITKKEGSYFGVLENFDILHNIPTRPGDSGGPIFNSSNQVIAIHWGKTTGPDGIKAGKGASFLNLNWRANSSELFKEMSNQIATADNRLDFWYTKQKTLTKDFIYATRAEWLPEMEEMLRITDRTRVSEAYKLKPGSKTLGAVSLEDHFSSSMELLYSFVPSPLQAQNTTAALLRHYIDLELKKISLVEDRLPENSWIRNNFVSRFKADYLNLDNTLKVYPPSNHDLALFVDSIDEKKWISVKGDLVPVVALPLLGRFWDAFYKKFYNGKDFGRRGVTIDRNCYFGPAYLQYVCSKQWAGGKYIHGTLTNGLAATSLTRTTLMHASDKIVRIEFNPIYWRPEFDAKLKKGILDGHINGMTIPQFIQSVDYRFKQNMTLKAEEYIFAAQSEAQLATWLSFAQGKELMSLSRIRTVNGFAFPKHSKLIKGIDDIDPEARSKNYSRN